ncbi:MAG: hypothetical protein ABIT04_07015 [Novosphingobium sp.]
MSEDPAKRRFFLIQALRWIGVALVIVGLLALYQRIPLPRALGTPLVPLGVATALIAPKLLARRWRSPRR